MKIRFSIFLLIFFVSANINANIPRDSVSNVKQLTWNDIVLQLSGTYVFSTGIFEDEDGSISFYPAQEKYGALGAFNNTGISFSKEYLYRIPKFNNIQGLADYQGHDEESGWGVYKTDNTICYSSEIDTILDSCVYLFEGFENGKKYIYFSHTKNSDFYERINLILKISNETTFNEWSLASLEQQALNIKNVRNYNDKKIAEAEEKKEEAYKPKWVAGSDITAYLLYKRWRESEEKKKKNTESTKKTEAKKIDPIIMDCTYSVNENTLSYNWVYDGLNVYWEGAPLNIGHNSLDETMTIDVERKGEKEFYIKIDMTLWQYEFINNFESKKSTIEFYGVKGFGRCY